MANVKISDLTGAASASGTQEFEVNDSGTSKKVTGSQLATFIEGEVSSSPTLTGQVSLDNGTNTAPSLTNTGDTNTGLYFPSDDTVGLAAGGGLKLSANASGIDVTGTVTADGLTVDDTSAYSSYVNGGTINLSGLDASSVNRNFATVKGLSVGNNTGALSVETLVAGSSLERIRVDYNGDISFYEDTGTTPKFFWDASAESLGIGTSSPDKLLHVNSSSSGVVAKITGPNAYNAESGLEFSVGRAKISGVLNGSGGTPGTSLRFFTMPDNGSITERMRIDASGNLLVGTTSAYGTTGTTINAAGLVYSSADADRAGQFDRTTSDGELVRFSKAGTTVGSIGTYADKVYIGNGDTGLRFVNTSNQIRPFNTSTVADRDAGFSLGSSGARFTDLYLSGGVYLGGTGSANKLDDYEEGTWVPEITTSGSNVSYSGQAGSYIKIGQMCVAKFQINLSGVTSQGTSTFQIGGLPFAATTTTTPSNHGRHSIQTYNVNVDGNAYQMLAYNNGATDIRVLYSYDNGTWSLATTSNFVLSSTSIITASVTYFTT